VVHALGSSVNLLEAALAEPAAVAWRAIGRGRPRPGERVAVVEAAGTAGAVERALIQARRGGRVALVGLAGNNVKAAFGIDDAVNNDLLISASFAYTSAAFAEVTALLSSGPRGKVILDINPEDAL
jgi:threonine dehydrogenase-like Zn-dependent dehydrogenase